MVWAKAHCFGVKSRPITGRCPSNFRCTSGDGMTFDFAAARQVMVETQVRVADVTDLALQRAMRAVAREGFCPDDKRFLAYADTEVEYAPGRWLLRPRDVGKL